MMEKRVEMLVELMKLLELMTLWWLPMEMKEEEDDLGDLLGVGGCCCGDGDEEELKEVRVLVEKRWWREERKNEIEM